MRGEEADFQVAGKQLQANVIMVRMRLDFKGDLIFEDFVFEQCERGMDATSYFRGLLHTKWVEWAGYKTRNGIWNGIRNLESYDDLYPYNVGVHFALTP